jgi:hypothetical protein
MKKALLLLDCDSCRQVYSHSCFASEDTTAWEIHGANLIQMAVCDGWAESYCRNYLYCPSCLRENEELSLNFL